jgi:hypothetical protein
MMSKILNFDEWIIQEALKSLYLDSAKLNWNKNKTDEEFEKRILERTSLSLEDFYKIAQAGINTAFNSPQKFAEDGDTCLYFMKSKFVLIVNKPEMMIRTIRDGRWDKPSNSCNKVIITKESDEQYSDLIENVFFNGTEFNGYKLNVITSDEWLLEVETDCKVCIKVDL